MITERTLKRWRKEALQARAHMNGKELGTRPEYQVIKLCEKILHMTQELLDLHLTREK